MAIYQVVPLQTFRSQEVRNVLHYETANPLDAGQTQEVADAVRAAWVNLDDGSNLVNDFVLYGAVIRRVDIADLPGTELSFTSGNFTGAVSGDPATANQVAMIVSAQAQTTKPRRSRSYLCGWSHNAIQDSGFFGAGALADAAVWADDMDEITVTGDTLLRVAVSYSGSPPAVTASNRLTSYQVRSNPGVQRRRRIGIGG